MIDVNLRGRVRLKRRARLRGYFVIGAAASLVLASCGSGGSGDSAPTSGTQGQTSAASAANPVTVTLLDSGTRTDFAWSQAWHDGVVAAGDALGSDVTVSYSDELTSAADLEQAGGAALSQGSKAVIYATSEVPEALNRLGEQFPDAFLCGVEVPRDSYQKNVCTIYPRLEEGSFLAGYLAAKASKTGHIGTVGAFDSPTLTAQMEGFALGARLANPDIRVDRAYTISLTDAGKGRAAAEAQYNAGADIIYAVLSQARTGVYSAARDHGGYVVGAYFDWYPEAKDVILTSVIYDLQKVSDSMLEMAAKGELEAKGYVFSEENSDFGDVTRPQGVPGELVGDDVFTEVEKLRDAARDGSLQIPDATVLGHRDAANSVDLSTLQKAAAS